MKKITILIAFLVLLLLPIDANAASKVKLSATKKTVTVGKTIKISLKNNKKKVKWSVSNSKIKIVKKTNQYVKIKAVKKGNATLKAKVGRKTYKCKITVKAKQKTENYSKYIGKYSAGSMNDQLEITYDGKEYHATWLAFRISTFDKLKGTRKGNVITFTQTFDTKKLVIDVEFIDDNKVVLTVVESNMPSYIAPGKKKTFWKE